jgi:hypothetical protein
MITFLAIAVPVAILTALSPKLGADSRPGFDERRPLA